MTDESIRNLRVWFAATTIVAIVLCAVLASQGLGPDPPPPSPTLSSSTPPVPSEPENTPDSKRLGLGELLAADLAPNGEFILVGTSIGISIYSTRTLDQTWNQAMPGRVVSVAVSPDNALIAGAVAGEVTVFDASTHEIVAALHHDFEVNRLGFNPLNNNLAVLSGGAVHVWDMTTSEQIEVIHRDSPIIEMEWSPYGRFLAMSSDGVLVRDSITGAEIRFSEQPEKGAGRLAWSDDGNWLVAGLSDGTSMIWDLTTLQSIVTQGAHSLYVNAIDVSPDLTLMATAGADASTVLIWDLHSGQQVFTLDNHDQTGIPSASILDVEFSGGGTRLISSAKDGSITEWDIGNGQPIRTLEGFIGAIKSVAWSPTGQYLATGGLDGTVHIWDVESLNATVNVRAGKELVRRMAWSPDGSLLATAAGENVILWDATTGELVRQFTYLAPVDDSAVLPIGIDTGTASHVVWDAAFSPDGSLLATGDEDGLVIIWSVETGEQLHSMAGHAHIVSYVHFMQDGMLVSASQDGTMITWNTDTGEQEASELFAGAATLTVSPDERFMAIGRSDATLSVREEGMLVSTTILEDSSDLMIRPTFSSDSSLCSAGLTNDMTTVGVFDPSSGALLGTYSGHSQAVLDAALSPDGRVLATASEDGSVLLWDVDAGFERLLE